MAIAELNAATDVLVDPLLFQQLCWPHVRFYDKQLDIIYSVRDNDETYVPAGNGLGKDFVSAFIVLWFFCSRRPCRVITTSVDHEQLKGVLWGEMRRFIQTSQYKLPIQVNDLFIRHVDEAGELDPLSYVLGRVVKKGEGLLGHHIARTADLLPRTLVIYDEASGVDDTAYETSDTWAHRKLVIGNPRPCSNFFKKGVKAGRLLAPDGSRLYREVIKIRAIDSPNVKIDLLRTERGLPPKNEIHIPGLVDYQLYLKRRMTLDKVRQSWVLDAEFYEGAETLLCPPDWLDRAETLARSLAGVNKRLSEHPDWLSFPHRKIRTMGVDSAEGGDDSVWTVVDRLGVINQYSIKTQDTNDIPGITLARARRFGVASEDIIFDRGGGGKEHADRLRASGHLVRTVAFGEAATDDIMVHLRQKSKREARHIKETSYEYKNRRAQMYGELRKLLDPGPQLKDVRVETEDQARNTILASNVSNEYVPPLGFAIPAELTELRRQLAPLPLLYNEEGRLYLPQKDKRSKESKEQTIKDLLGRSPDQSDSLVLAVYGLLSKPLKRIAGAA